MKIGRVQYDHVYDIEGDYSGARILRQASHFAFHLGFGILLSDTAAQALPLCSKDYSRDGCEEFFFTEPQDRIFDAIERYCDEDLPHRLIVELPQPEPAIPGSSGRVYDILREGYHKTFPNALAALPIIGMLSYDRWKLAAYGEERLIDEASKFLSGICGHTYQVCWWWGERFTDSLREDFRDISAVTVEELRDDLLHTAQNDAYPVLNELCDRLRDISFERRGARASRETVQEREIARRL